MRENRPYGLAGGETEINRSSLPRSENRSTTSAEFAGCIWIISSLRLANTNEFSIGADQQIVFSHQWRAARYFTQFDFAQFLKTA